MFQHLVKNLIQYILFALCACALLLFGSSARAAGEQIILATDAEQYLQGEEVTLTVYIDGNGSPVTGIDSFIQYDPAVFERIGSGQVCDSSEYSDIVIGDWFLQSCLIDDTANGQMFITVSKTILLGEAGYGVTQDATAVFAIKLKVREDAPDTITELALNIETPRISKLFSNGVALPQGQDVVSLLVGEQDQEVQQTKRGVKGSRTLLPDTTGVEVAPIVFDAPSQAKPAGVSDVSNEEIVERLAEVEALVDEEPELLEERLERAAELVAESEIPDVKRLWYLWIIVALVALGILILVIRKIKQ